MTWRDDLRKVVIELRGKPVELIGASFRGVPFLVESSDRTGGRRVVVHEFPGRDQPFIEELGQRAGSFRVEGYVIGDGYVAQRDALRVALEETAGPGKLIHPYHGERTAICTQLTIHETRAAGAMATFAIDFADAPAQSPTPTIEPDPAGRVATSADIAATAAKAELLEQFDPAGLPAFALTSAETALTSAAAGLAAKLGPAARAAAQLGDVAEAVTQELAILTGQIHVLTVQAASLVRAPADLFEVFRGAITGLGETAAAARGAVLDALVDAYATDLGSPPALTTATREREAANLAALSGALRRVIALEAARLAPLVPYASIEEATAARDQVAGLLEEQAAGAGDTAYPALVDLRSEVLRAVPGPNVFARVLTVTRRMPVPSLVLAYQLYGSVDNEADVVARNPAATHPGFMSGDLKVLSSGG